MDEYTVVNTELLNSELTTQESNLRVILWSFWISFAPVMLECCCLSLMGLGACVGACTGQALSRMVDNIKDNCEDLGDEVKTFSKAYFTYN